MSEVKSLLFNSLSVSIGLIIYTLFIYICYLIFYREGEIKKEIDKEIKKEVKEVIDNFDILED